MSRRMRFGAGVTTLIISFSMALGGCAEFAADRSEAMTTAPVILAGPLQTLYVDLTRGANTAPVPYVYPSAQQGPPQTQRMDISKGASPDALASRQAPASPAATR